MTKTKFVPTNIEPAQLPSDSAFICDASLGRIAKHLRMLGIDVMYDKNSSASHVLFLARKTKRILITRNRGMVNGLINNEHERLQKKLRKQMRKEGAAILQQQQAGAAEPAVELDEQQKLVQEWLLRKEEEKRKQMEKLKKEKEEILQWKREEAAAKKSMYSNEEEEEEQEEAEDKVDDEEQEEEVFEEEWEEQEEDDDDDVNYQPVKYYFVRERQFADQITNLVNFFKIRYSEEKLFSRCLVCNNKINPIPNKEDVKHLVFASVYQEHDQFYRCQGCKKIYWGKDSEREHVNFRTARVFALQHSYKGEPSTTTNGSAGEEESTAEPSKTDSDSTIGITTEA